MSARLAILKNSLVKKKAAFDARLQNHFDTVAQANGQPLNDKRNGAATLKKWDAQNDALRTLDQSIKKTKTSIEREQSKISKVSSFQIPAFLQAAIDRGEIAQWRKYPNRFFVVGVDKARIVYDANEKTFAHVYAREIKDKEQYAKFRDVYNALRQESARGAQ